MDICPTNSINIVDNLDHMDAVINDSTCINCGLCYKTCGQNHPAELRKIQEWLQGWTEDNIHLISSSGSLVQALMHDFIKRGGYLAACKLIDGLNKFVLYLFLK